MLLRLLTFKEALATADADSLYDAEFTDRKSGLPDLEVSVYRAPAEALPDLILEHHAFAGIDPPRGKSAVDVEPVAKDCRHDPTSSCFPLTRDAHHVVVSRDEAEVRAFASALIGSVRDETCRVLRSERSELRARLVVRADEPAWNAFLAAASDEWKKFSKAEKKPK